MGSPITTHVLDTSAGKPAQGIVAILEFREPDGTLRAAGRGTTDEDGRIQELMAADFQWKTGSYRLTFDVGAYQDKMLGASFYSSVSVDFNVVNLDQHYHIPLLLSPFGYTTYRGS